MIPFAVRLRLLYAYGKIMTKWDSCIFCQIIADEMLARVIHADDHCIAIEDVHPKAPVHALVLPRKHIATLADGSEEDGQLLGHLLLVAARVDAVLLAKKGALRRLLGTQQPESGCTRPVSPRG